MPSGSIDPSAFQGADIGAKINSVIASLGSQGGSISIPPGDYSYSTPIVADGRQSITIEGSGSPSSGSMAVVLRYSGTVAAAVSARSTLGFGLRGLMLLYQSGFEGHVVDLSGNASDTALALVERCFLGGVAGTATAQSLIYLDKAISSTVRGCGFSGAQVAIRGSAGGPSTYSNVIQVLENYFVSSVVAHIVNGRQGWLIAGNTFEPLAGHNAGAYLNEDQSTSNGLTFVGNWCGDATSVGSWIRWSGNGLLMQGNYIASGSKGLEIAGSSNFAIVVMGNDFESLPTGIDLGASPNAQSGVTIQANRFSQVPTPVANSHAGHTQVAVLSNSSSGPQVLNQISGAVGLSQIVGNTTLAGNLVVSGQMATSKTGLGSISLRDYAGGVELHLRPVGSKSGVISFTEDGVADLWTIQSGASDRSLRFGTGSAGASTNRLSLKDDGTLELTAPPKFGAGNTPGAANASLGANCPASSPSAPFTWLAIRAADGQIAYIPCWR
ncbi:MAG: hypothetical protein JNM38_14790 [Acidobacteria bacterium]|nr:hypothetical protein [Acidobacteriota bacterium]